MNNQKYVQSKNLNMIFDLSTDFFQKRINIEFFEGIHFLIPPNSSKTKKVVLWDIDALDNWFRGNKVNDELQKLLKRR